MRAIFFLILLNFSTVLSAQSDFSKQINAIIKDSSNKFRSFKGSFKGIKPDSFDSIFYSTIVIEATSENDITSDSVSSSYAAAIIDSVKEKNAKKIAEEWKDKLVAELKGRYKIIKIEPSKTWKYSRGGWRMEYPGLIVSITIYQHYFNPSLYSVTLWFMVIDEKYRYSF